MGRERDQFWAYAVKVNGHFKCNFCEQNFSGGASRIKAHLAGVPGHDIKACNAVPQEVQEKAQAITQKKREAQATQGTNKKLKSASTSTSKLKTKDQEGYMAEIVLNDVVERLIANAFSLIGTENISFESSFKVELKNLLETLFKIKFLLDDAQKRQSSDESVRIWLMNLRDVAYDADNMLDVFSYESFWQEVQAQNLMVDQVRSFSFWNPDKVKTIKLLLDKIVHDVAGFGLRMELVNSIPNISLDMNIYPLLDDSEVVGREYDVTKMVNVLISSSNQQVISVLPIVGMAGLGKTTLAKLVYNHELIKKHFDVLAWVNVGKNFDVEEILRKIPESLDHLSLVVYGGGHQICAEILGEKKYLLILDDVHNEDPKKWDTLKGYLSKFNSSTGNNIVVTTRSDNVAKIMETHPKHQLEKLSKDDCWSIFKKRTFTNGRIPLTLDLEVIGREIAKRCGGVPWAASVLGGTMSFQFDKNKWLEIQNNKIWDLLDEDNSDIFPVLKLCFDHLPTPSLKRCFTYCAIFPKDHAMKKDEVIQYWMAEGFLELAKEVNMVMEDIGNMYFNILLATSFFQNARMDGYGNIISCKMHDLVHDFALLISKSESLILEGDPVDNVSGIQPLFVRFDSKTTPETSFSGDGFIKVRTLILENFNFDIMLPNFRCLRVLKLSSHGLPDSIEQLIHLRLLDIYQTRIKELPKSITKLYNLQTLRIEIWGYVQFSLPEDLSNLIKLRHIHINGTLSYLNHETPKNMRRLTCLQTLPIFIVGSDEGYLIKELGPLKNLRGEIRIENLVNVKDEGEAKSAKLKEKEILKLGLFWNKFCGELDMYDIDKDEKVLEGLQPHPNLKSLTISEYRGKKFPSWVVGLSSLYHNLIEIKLYECSNCEEVPTLGQLPCLRVLEMEGMGKVRCIGSEFYFYSDGSYRNTTTLFPALRILELVRMISLEEWKDADEVLFVFPCLEELIIRGCDKLRDLPDSLHTCASLQKLVVIYCPKLRSLPGVRSIIRSGIEEPPSASGLQYLENGDCPLPSSSSTSSIHPSQRVVGLSSLYHNLIEINLYACSNFEEVPTLGQLPCLRVLEMEGMGKVRRIGSEFYFYSDGSYRNTTTLLFPALRILKLMYMRNLEEWKDAKELTTADEVLFVFPCLEELTLIDCDKLRDLPDSLHTCVSLQKLVVDDCPKLRSLPGVPSVIRHLEIIECGIDELPSGLQLCTSLQYLKIEGCPNLKSIPDLGEVFHSLINLKLINSPDLRLKLPLRRLKTLVIGGFIEELDAFPILRYPFIRYSHASLKRLRLHGSPILNSLPNEIQLFTALEELRIQNFNGMEALPDWFSYLSSLQKLSLYYCKKLMYLPILHLTNLKHLHIARCPNLEKRCVEESSAEWLQMAHIRNIKINENYIKGKDSEDSEDFDDYDDSEDEESDKYDDSEDDRGDYLLEDSIWGNDQFDDN